MKRVKINWKNLFILLVVLFIMLLGVIKLFEIVFIGDEVVKSTPVGDYTCTGGLLKVCSGSKEVYDYLGV